MVDPCGYCGVCDVSLEHSYVSLEHSYMSLEHSYMSLEHSYVSLEHSYVFLEHSYACHTIKVGLLNSKHFKYQSFVL